MKTFPALLVIALTFACDDSDDADDGGAAMDADTNADGSGGDAPSPSGCDDAITDCSVGSLSAEQQANYCDLLLAALDSEPGTRFECAATETFLEVSTREACVATEFASTCAVTVGEVIDCFQAAEQDPCAAFDGPCEVVFATDNGCGG